LPYNNKHELFLQDRRGFKAPDWGFFSGSIAGSESPLDAVIKAAKKELSLDVTEDQLIHLGDFSTAADEETNVEAVSRAVYLYKTDQAKFTVTDGPGGHWLSYAGSAKRLEPTENFDEIWLAIEAMEAQG